MPAGFIVNSDFWVRASKSDYGPSYAMPVRAPLQTALDHWSVQATIPASITENIAGYCAAVSWLTRTVEPNVTFGWPVNVWGMGASEWIYSNDDEPAQNAQLTADYITSAACIAATKSRISWPSPPLRSR